jgi:hypothetical protein
VLTGRGSAELLPLGEAVARLRAFERRQLGLRTIPLSQIVGSEGRVSDSDRDFLPLRGSLRQ